MSLITNAETCFSFSFFKVMERFDLLIKEARGLGDGKITNFNLAF
jgi:hypothetical protein